MSWFKKQESEKKTRTNIFSKIPSEPDYCVEIMKIRDCLSHEMRASSFECLGYTSAIEEINTHFMSWPYRGTTTSLVEFLIRLDIPFNQKIISDITQDNFLDFCETILNMLSLIYESNRSSYGCLDGICNAIHQQLIADLDGIGYIARNCDDGRVIIVPRDAIADDVATNEPDIGERIVMYRHRSLEGDIQGKKDIILAIGQYIEPLLQNKDLKQLLPTVIDDTRFALNNMDIRHNNKEGKYAKKGIGSINLQAYERHLDNLFTLMLMVLQGKDLLKIHNEFEAVKKMIN